MQIKRLIYALVPIIALSPSAISNTEGESDDNGIVISKRETTATPGGFSAVAEPAGPVDPEAAKRAAERYHFHITLLGTPVEVEATPVSFNWDWGDGQSFDTTDPGAPYSNYTVSHPYEVTGDGYVIKLRTSWSARWRIAGQAQWHQVNGTVTTTETSSPFNLYIADSYGTTP